MEKDTGGTAFPWAESYVNVDKGERHENYGDAGMTLRDYFATKAMQGELTSGGESNHLDSIASRSYAIADAMLRARGQ